MADTNDNAETREISAGSVLGIGLVVLIAIMACIYLVGYDYGHEQGYLGGYADGREMGYKAGVIAARVNSPVANEALCGGGV